MSAFNGCVVAVYAPLHVQMSENASGSVSVKWYNCIFTVMGSLTAKINAGCKTYFHNLNMCDVLYYVYHDFWEKLSYSYDSV